MEPTVDARIDTLIQKLKTKGMRLTPQRLAVIKNLASNQAHPTVEEVYKAVRREFPMTSLATVYKTISVLKEMNELVELRTGGQAVRYDAVSGQAHPHLYCVSCLAIKDVDFPGWNQFAVSLHESTGYQVQRFNMDILGLCPDCQIKTLSV